MINLWRPIRFPVFDSPLTVCDAATVAPGDLVPTDLVYRDRVGETYSVTFNPAHRWFYLPRMRTDEALLLKCYDPKTDGRARSAPHSAFKDPNTPDAAARKHRAQDIRLPLGLTVRPATAASQNSQRRYRV